MSSRGVKIIGVGKAVPGYNGIPGRILDNETFSQEFNDRVLKDQEFENEVARMEFIKEYCTDGEWITKRMGVQTRSHADENLSKAILAAVAIEEALKSAGLTINDVDMLDVATVSHETDYSPPDSTRILGILGWNSNREIVLRDTSLACSSVCASLDNAVLAILSGRCRVAVVVGVDIMSRTANPYDRTFYPILGDGTGVLVLIECPEEEATFLSTDLFCSGCDPKGNEIIVSKNDWSHLPFPQPPKDKYYLWMDGPAVYKDVGNLIIPDGKYSEKSIIAKARMKAFGDISLSGIQHIFFHQANLRMLKFFENVLKKSGFKGEAFNNIDKYGNTTSAAIPMLLCEAHEQGRLRYGDSFMIVVFGGGYTWYVISGIWRMK